MMRIIHHNSGPIHYLVLLVYLIVGLIGCSDKHNSEFPKDFNTESHKKPIRFYVQPSQLTLATNTTGQLTACLQYDDDSQAIVTDQVDWQVIPAEIATVQTGEVSALQPGHASIYATLPMANHLFSDTVELNVTDSHPVALSIEPAWINSLPGFTYTYQANALFSDNHIQDVSHLSFWTSSDSQVAILSKRSQLLPTVQTLAKGTSQIQATFTGLLATSRLQVFNENPEALLIHPVNQVLPIATSYPYVAVLIFPEGRSLNVTTQCQWQSDSNNVASFSPAPRLLAHNQGTTWVSANLNINGKTYSDRVKATVTESELVNIVIKPAHMTLPTGQSTTFNLLANYQDGRVVDITGHANVRIDDSQHATLLSQTDQNITVAAIEPGIATVNANFEGMQANASITITDADLTAIDIEPLDKQQPAGIALHYQGIARFSDHSSLPITHQGFWQSTDTSIATINATGQQGGTAMGETAGLTGIRLFWEKEAQTPLNIIDPAVNDLHIKPINASLPKDTVTQYHAILYLPDGQSFDITSQATWTSSRPDILSVITHGDRGGQARALLAGTTTIKATYLTPNNGVLSQQTQATVTDNKLNQLILTPESASIPVGLTQTYSLTAIFNDGSKKDVSKAAYWQVISTPIAEVMAAATIKGLSVGETVIKATYLDQFVTAQIRVEAAILDRLVITPQALHLPIGSQQLLTAMGYFSDGRVLNITELSTWSSDNPAVASVSTLDHKKGNTLAKSVGNTSITAVYEGHDDTIEVEVTDAVPIALAVRPLNVHVPTGVDQQYQAFLTLSSGESREVTHQADWHSSHPEIASIEAKSGLVASHKTGSTILKAHYPPLTAQTTLFVDAPALERIDVSPGKATISAGTSQQYKATFIYTDGKQHDGTTLANWHTSDNTIANIGTDKQTAGLANGKQAGHVDIYADFKSKSGQAELEVTKATPVALLIDPMNSTIPVDHTVSFKAMMLFTDKTRTDVTHDTHFFSSDSTIATISLDGKAKGIQGGKTNITAHYKTHQALTRLTVTEDPIKTLTVTPVAASITADTTLQYKAMAEYVSSPSRDVTHLATWSSANNTVIQIVTTGDYGGKALAIDVGTSTITAKFGSESDEVTTTVNAGKQVTSINITPQDYYELYQGKSKDFQATAIFSDGSHADVTNNSEWLSSNEWAATVESDNAEAGKVIGNNSGQTSISVFYHSASNKTDVKVLKVYPVSLVIVPDKLTVVTHNTAAVKAMATMNTGDLFDYTDKVIWSSDNFNIATVEAGVITGESQGTTKIRANFETVNATVSVTVTDAPP